MSLIKNEVLLRTYAVLFVVVLAAFIIYGRAVTIHTVEGEYWRSKADSLYVRYMPVKGERGNILADDGSFLATSLPLFELRMDVNSSALTDEVFKQNLDSLAWCLATYVDKRYTVGGYRDLLINERKKGQRYLLIKDNATFEEVEQIRKFPLFRLGRYKGGLIERQKSERIKPFGILASRTIGYNKGDTIKVGLEGAFDRTLSGAEGKQLMQRIGTNWVPINDLAEIAPERGEDVVTTIDVNIQDIAENALKNAVNYHNADNATAVVMEVKTGAIKAIANIGKGAEGLYEDYNYAIGLAYEPGSTFKAISMLSMLEDGLVDLDDTIDLELGKTEFMTHTLRDAHSHKIRETSVRKAFCMSSNVG
ncbi:MAG: penicillin-binding transpeptidase domain-containing protein, partial [Saprospiraceae bacterium]